VLSLYLFGENTSRLLSGAVIGIVIGTYSSIAVAAPMLVAYQDWRAGKRGNTPSPACTGESSRQGVKKQDRKWSLRSKTDPTPVSNTLRRDSV